MVDLEWYRTFKAVYQTGSLTAAARILFISQPNVSQHLSALEAHIGRQLFERKPRLVPTDDGKLFYTQVVEPLEKLENVEQSFSAMRSGQQLPVIRLGSAKEIFQALSVKRLGSLKADVVVSFGLTKELLSKLSEGELDFVIATQRTERKDITFEPLLTESFIITGNADLDTSSLKSLVRKKDWAGTEAWLSAQTWYAYSADLAIIRRFWLTNFNKRPPVKPRFIIPDMHTILDAIRVNGGVTVAASYLLKDMPVIWKGHTPTTNTIYLAYDKTKTTMKSVELVRSLLQ